ncbi:MAG TPA: SulP family inorganic anion transporter [Acidimicrobiales bacterium]|nr:SulP family inorganic anion transporter [Acidimicrobiales bacterium]
MRSPALFTSLTHGYQRKWLRGDVIAGLTVWAVLVPEALAYASIAGVSPVVGLYAAPGALLLYAAFGSSRQLVTGPMAATAALSAAAVGSLAAGGSDEFVQLTITLAITVGIIAIIAGLLRLGFLANFISEPVLKGFIIGLALTIIVGQLPKLFGVPKGEGAFFRQLWHLLTDLDQTSAVTLLVGVASLALVLGLKRWLPIVPGSLVTVLLGIAAVHVFDLATHGVAIVGQIESGLPSLGFPNVAAHSYLDLAPAAIGVMLVGFAEALGAGNTYAEKNHYEIDPNRELIALGAANLGAGLSSGMVVNGSLSKTAVNASAGARSQLSGLVVAVLTIVTLLFLTGLFEDLPEATLAAVVIAALIDLVDVPSLVRLYRLHTAGLGRIYGFAARPDFISALAALFGVLIFDTLPGLFIGIGVSLTLLLYRASRPNIAVLGRVPGSTGDYADIQRNARNQPVPGVAVLRVESGLFFANADTIRKDVLAHAADGTKAIVLDGETVPFIDVTAAQMLETLAEDLERDGIQLLLARDVGQVRDVLSRQQRDRPVAIRAFPTVQAAVTAALGPVPATPPKA